MTAAAAGFAIANDLNGRTVLYVTSDTSKNELTLTFTYVGGAPVTLKGGAPVAEPEIAPSGPTSLYFTVSSVLSPAEFAAMTVTTPAQWQAKLIKSWVLTPVCDLPVKPGDNFEFKLTHITADGQPGPGSLNIDYYNIPGIADSGTQLPLSLEELPNRHKDLASVLHLSMAGSNEVFIDVDNRELIPSNTLVLRFVNSSKAKLYPGTDPWPTRPVFFLTFVSAKAAPGYGALTTVDRLKNITVSQNGDYGTEWTVVDLRQKDPPHWAIYPKSLEILGTGAAAVAEFKIDDIVTDFAPGPTLLYLQSSGIPGYDDGSMAIPLDKKVPELAIQGPFAQQNNVRSGTKVNLVWKTFDADWCILDPGDVKVPPQSGTKYVVTPTRTTTYALTAHNDSQGAAKSAEVSVYVQPVRFATPLTADPKQSSHYGDPVSLSWEVVSSTGCTIDPPIGGSSKVPSKDTKVVHPTSPVTYTLTAQGQDGPVESEVTLIPVPSGWKSVADAGKWDTWGRPVMLAEFLDRLWFLAGGSEDAKSSVFSTRDGFNWVVETNDADFSPRGDAAGCVWAGSGGSGAKLWLTGGATRSGAVDEIWNSDDGVKWSQVVPDNPHWSPRTGHGCVAHAGKIWVFGGRDGTNKPLNDVWNSTDGRTWAPVAPSSIWPARSGIGAISFGGEICMVAGQGANGPLRDAWASSDGLKWRGMGNTIPWIARSNPALGAIGETLYLVGGTGPDGKGLSDASTFDASRSWGMGLGPNWGPDVINVAGASFLGALWFAGGTKDRTANRTVWGFG